MCGEGSPFSSPLATTKIEVIGQSPEGPRS